MSLKAWFPSPSRPSGKGGASRPDTDHLTDVDFTGVLRQVVAALDGRGGGLVADGGSGGGGGAGGGGGGGGGGGAGGSRGGSITPLTPVTPMTTPAVRFSLPLDDEDEDEEEEEDHHGGRDDDDDDAAGTIGGGSAAEEGATARSSANRLSSTRSSPSVSPGGSSHGGSSPASISWQQQQQQQQREEDSILPPSRSSPPAPPASSSSPSPSSPPSSLSSGGLRLRDTLPRLLLHTCAHAASRLVPALSDVQRVRTPSDALRLYFRAVACAVAAVGACVAGSVALFCAASAAAALPAACVLAAVVVGSAFAPVVVGLAAVLAAERVVEALALDQHADHRHYDSGDGSGGSRVLSSDTNNSTALVATTAATTAMTTTTTATTATTMTTMTGARKWASSVADAIVARSGPTGGTRPATAAIALGMLAVVYPIAPLLSLAVIGALGLAAAAFPLAWAAATAAVAIATLLRRIDRLPGAALSVVAGLAVVPNFLAVYLVAAPAAALSCLLWVPIVAAQAYLLVFPATAAVVLLRQRPMHASRPEWLTAATATLRATLSPPHHHHPPHPRLAPPQGSRGGRLHDGQRRARTAEGSTVTTLEAAPGSPAMSHASTSPTQQAHAPFVSI